jgi:eukaryotic-like serine/threonine-protein kinase
MSALGDVDAGHTLGRYELLVPIAQGGMAAVWAARMKGTRGFQKLVAVKTMLPELSQDPQFEEMFLAEASLASSIRHPHVCEILDLGEQDGLLYIVMEWIDGEALSSLARAARHRGAIPTLVALRLCLGAALGLHAAHELKDESGDLVGLVHRDVSPQNILVTYDGVVKIVDFGVAKATAESDQGHTKDGQVKGKIPFMSPEQALGKAVDRRTDIFALGIVLYQILANKHPFRGDNDMITMRRICEKTPAPSLAENMPGCPPVVHQLVMKALEKAPEDRYQTMAEMARALDLAIAELKTSSLPDEDVGAFVKSVLGERAEKRRAAIRDGLKLADERAQQREQMRAQRAALIAEAKARGGTIPPGMSLPPLSIPPALVSRGSLPPPASSSPGSGVSSLDSPTVAHGRASLMPPGTVSPPSAPSAAGAVVDIGTMGEPGGGKKKLAVIGFAAVGVIAIGAAAFVFGRGETTKPTDDPARGAAASPPASASPAPVVATAPASTTAPVVTAPAVSAAPSSTPKSSGAVRAPSTKATASAKPKPRTPDNLPKVRDPGF